MTVSADQEEMKSNRHEEESDEKHVTNTDSPPSTTLSLSPQSNRSYMTPSPAGDFGTYSWADDPEPRPKAHPNRSFPAEPLVVLTKPLDHPDEPPKNDVVFDHHSVESHEADYDYDDDEEEEEQNDDVEAEKERSAGDGGGKSGGGLGSFNRRKLRPDLTRKAAAKTTRKSSSSSTSSHGVAKGALLGLRVCGFAFSLISLAVMASNRNQGWALDSFYRYKEFRYCFGVNLLGFIYSGFQVLDLIHFATTHKHLVQHRFRYYSDFFIDQAISYLLMSASSSASTRVDDWQSNWGKDKFPDMAHVSVGFSFAAFAALALSSIISGYMLCTAKAL